MTTRLFFSLLLCFLVLSSQRMQAQGATYNSRHAILQFTPWTEDVASVNSMLSTSSPGKVIDSALVFGLFLVEFDKLDFEGIDCDKIPDMLKKVCPRCASPTPHSPTGIQGGGGGLNYRTFDSFAQTKKTTTQSEETWMNTWGHIIDGEYKDGCPVKVAFLDTGIDKEHLSSTSWFANTSTATIPQFPTYNDDHGHGSHVIGITAQIVRNCNNIKLLSIKTQHENGEGTVWTAIKGIELAIGATSSSTIAGPTVAITAKVKKEEKFNPEKGEPANIINMSLAYRPECIGDYEQPLEAAMRISREMYKVLFITAAGNDGQDLNEGRLNIYPSMFNFENQINVAALNDDYSLVNNPDNWGTNYGAKFVNIGAFGVGINSAVLHGAFDNHDGTSAAAPQVTAIASIIASLSCNQGGYAHIRDCILSTAGYAELPLSTSGYLQPEAAIRCQKRDGEGKAKGRSNEFSYSDNEYKIYPNPFDEALNIEFVPTNEKEVTQCTLYNSTGQIIQKTNYEGNINSSWNVQDLPKGVYLLKIQHGTTQEVQKLIKQ
jgi:Subtilase family/Secretion system C-terminal sorting domain